MKSLKIFVFVFFLGQVLWSQSNNLSKTDKIFGLSKFWQEVNQNFVFLDKVGQDNWNDSFKKYIVEVQNTSTDYEYYRLLQKFCAELNDGHTNVYMPKGIKQLRTHFGDTKLILENIEGRAIITNVNVSKKDEIPIGSEVILVNNLPTKEFIAKNVKPYISASTDFVREDMSVRNLLLGHEGDVFHIEIKTPSGEIKKLKLVHESSKKESFHPKTSPFKPFEVYQKNNIAIVTANTFEDENIIQELKKHIWILQKAKGIIIDLRNNQGGNSTTAANLLSYFTKDSIITGAKSVTRQYIPTYEAWGKFMQPKDTILGKWAKEAYNYYNNGKWFEIPTESFKNIAEVKIIKPTIILTSHDTASAAEDFVVMARSQKHITTLGAKTNGSTGQPIFFELPGGAQARVCTKKDTYPDGTEFVGFGITPDIAIKPTYDDFINGLDRQMAEALKVLAMNIN